MVYLCLAFSVIVPYLLCSINPAIVVSKMKGKNIREMGSGNPGLTNTLRTMGKGAAAVVLLFDVLKGVIAIFAVKIFCYYLLPHEQITDSFPFYDFFSYMFMWVGSLASVLGHCYPLYYKFKGGKAVLVTVATGLVINWLTALLALSVFILIVLITKYVSLGSMIAATAYAIFVRVFESGDNAVIGTLFCGTIALFLIFNHRGNIKRILNGTEKKLGEKK